MIRTSSANWLQALATGEGEPHLHASKNEPLLMGRNLSLAQDIVLFALINTHSHSCHALPRLVMLSLTYMCRAKLVTIGALDTCICCR